MCDAEKDWHELNKPEINFSFFIFEPPVAYLQKPFWFYRAKIQNVYVCCNDTNLSSLVVGFPNLREVWQCRMHVCPAYHDQAVIRFFFYVYSTLLHSKFYIC